VGALICGGAPGVSCRAARRPRRRSRPGRIDRAFLGAQRAAGAGLGVDDVGDERVARQRREAMLGDMRLVRVDDANVCGAMRPCRAPKGRSRAQTVLSPQPDPANVSVQDRSADSGTPRGAPRRRSWSVPLRRSCARARWPVPARTRHAARSPPALRPAPRAARGAASGRDPGIVDGSRCRSTPARWRTPPAAHHRSLR